MMTLTSTKVPKFSGVTSWEQYRQVCTIKCMGRRYSCPTVVISLGGRCAECGSSGAGDASCNTHWIGWGTERITGCRAD